MITLAHMRGFVDEVGRIVKKANLSMATPPGAKPESGMGEIKPKKPNKGGVMSGSSPSYSKVHSTPKPDAATSYQPTSAAPVVK